MEFAVNTRVFRRYSSSRWLTALLAASMFVNVLLVFAALSAAGRLPFAGDTNSAMRHAASEPLSPRIAPVTAANLEREMLRQELYAVQQAEGEHFGSRMDASSASRLELQMERNEWYEWQRTNAIPDTTPIDPDVAARLELEMQRSELYMSGVNTPGD